MRATPSADGRRANIYLSTTINIVNGSINCDARRPRNDADPLVGAFSGALNGPLDTAGRGGSGDRDAFA